MKQGSEITPPRRRGRGGGEFENIKLCELSASAVNTSSQETQNNYRLIEFAADPEATP